MRRHCVSKCSSSALSFTTHSLSLLLPGTHSAYSLCACVCVCVSVSVSVRAALCKSVLPIYEPANSASVVVIVVGADFYAMLFDVDCRLSSLCTLMLTLRLTRQRLAVSAASRFPLSISCRCVGVGVWLWAWPWHERTCKVLFAVCVCSRCNCCRCCCCCLSCNIIARNAHAAVAAGRDGDGGCHLRQAPPRRVSAPPHWALRYMLTAWQNMSSVLLLPAKCVEKLKNISPSMC